MPTQAQASEHRAQQVALTTAAVLAARRAFLGRVPLASVISRVAAYQLAAVTLAIRGIAAMSRDRRPVTVPESFMGISSLGFPLSEPLVATIDRYVPAPAEQLPADWWGDQAAVFLPGVEQLIASEVADAYRTASQVEFVAREEFTRYVRMVNLPACKRCVVLAGRVYIDLDAFKRHPRCDCTMVGVADVAEAKRQGLVADPVAAVRSGQVTGLSAADTQAILDGADPSQVINATAGTRQPGMTNAISVDQFGRRVKATTSGATKRAAWRRANPSRLVRLRPESIYASAGGDRDEALRLLRLYGYLKGNGA